MSCLGKGIMVPLHSNRTLTERGRKGYICLTAYSPSREHKAENLDAGPEDEAMEQCCLQFWSRRLARLAFLYNPEPSAQG